MSPKISPAEALSQMEATLSQDNSDPLDLAFQNAAAVLVYFEPKNIYPFGDPAIDKPVGWDNFFNFCDPAKKKGKGSFWQLRPAVRRESLKRLGNRENMIAALNANPERPQNKEQDFFERILKDEAYDARDLHREDLVTLSLIVEWLHNIIPMYGLKEQIERNLPMADLLSPMRRLVSTDFVGRSKELNMMSEYVGIVNDKGFISSASRFVSKLFTDLNLNPPLLIYGPGGIGKSTLMGKFILDNVVQMKVPLLFAYLDTDRAIIDPMQPKTYLMEAARQLASQISEHKDALLSLKDDIAYGLLSYDSMEVSKSFYQGSEYTQGFGWIISQVKIPVVIVVDTFEEVQYMGEDAVHGVWSLFEEMQQAAPNLRIIVMGRAMVNAFPVKEIPLTDLSIEEARQLVSNGLKDDFENSTELKKITNEIIDVAGLNPMSLRLSLLIVHEQGVEKLKQVETKNWFIRRVRSELIQARLYGRILTHIHDDNIKKLAYPGLIVRRITKGVIEEVLAGPCQLKLDHPGKVDEMLEILANEAALIDRDPDDGALCHRQDVRRVMLSDLKNEVSAEVVKKIHDNAIAYYSRTDSKIHRAEEIYHRLSRGDDPKDIDKRWIPGLETRLRGAMEELPQKSLIWLSNKLGVTPDKNVLKNADLENWEEITANSAQRFLQTGQPKMALDAMRERADRTSSSPLYRLELETLRYIGLYDEAAFVADEMIATIPKAANPAIVCEVYVQAALIMEAKDQLDHAIDYIQKAKAFNPPEAEREALRILITHTRFLRKKGDPFNDERAKVIGETDKWLGNEKGYYSLRDNPALFKEIVAELGEKRPVLLDLSLDWFPLEVRTPEQITLLATALHDWNMATTENSSRAGELAERAGLEANGLTAWQNYVKRNAGRRLGAEIRHWRNELLMYYRELGKENLVAEFDKALINLYRNNVDLSIKRGFTDAM